MKQVLASVFVGLVISAVIAVQSAESQPEVSFEEANRLTKAFRQWMIGANVKGVVLSKASWNDPSDKNYHLKGRTTRKFLQYEKQVFGINLGWTDNASATTARKRSKWFFARKGGRQGPIRYGETIAIGWGKSPSFIKYDHRNVGINLDWSDKPVYEWTILGGKPGTPVQTGRDWVILYNLAHGHPLIYFDRTKGGDIGWPDSKTWSEAARGHVNSLLKEFAKEAVKKGLMTLIGASG